ncbi:MAG: hypothetical protein K5739_01510 [Lachnospiraceae bacterium]|nr:hypothetical protein [Lachnospiraceae bacterium]
MAATTLLGGCGQHPEKQTASDGSSLIKDVVIHATVRTTGQYPEQIVISLGKKLADANLSAEDFSMKGHADSWMNTSLHEFSSAFEKAELTDTTLTLYPKDFPEKFFYVKDFTVECSKNSDLHFTYEDVSSVITPVADDFAYIKKEDGPGFDLRLFTPESTEKMPVVVVFHGFSDTANLLTYRTAVEWAEPENQKKRPCYIVAPVIDDATYYTAPGRDKVFEQLKGMLDDMIAEGKADPDRIYVMGNSFGGMSSVEFGEKYPDFVAGILSLCPALNYSQGAAANIEKIKDIPTRFAHASGDGTIPVTGTRAAFEALQKAGAKDVDFKEYSDDEMNAAGAEPGKDSTYSYHHVELAVMEDDSYMEWLYSQVRNH